MQRKTQFSIGEYYHVYNRGIDKGLIFRDKSDWTRMQNLLYLCNNTESVVFKQIQGVPLEVKRGKQVVDIVCYALMSNHFHLILREKRQGGISKFMSKVMTAYSMYFNTKYDRTGPLLCKPFRASHVSGDEYFRWVFSYVTLNPLGKFDPLWKTRGVGNVAAARKFMEKYNYSSYYDYFVKDRPQTKILEKK